MTHEDALALIKVLDGIKTSLDVGLGFLAAACLTYLWKEVK